MTVAEAMSFDHVQAGTGPGRGLDRVVVINDISMSKGGATGVALKCVQAARAVGVAVTFFTGDNGEGLAGAEEGVEVIGLGNPHILEGPRLAAAGRGLYNVEAARRLASWIARYDTPSTVYHVHGWSKILSPAIFAPLARVGPRLLIHAHDYFLACPNGGFYDYRKGLVCARQPNSVSCLATNCDRRSYAQKAWRAVRHASLGWNLPKSGQASLVAVHEGMIPLLARGGYERARIQVLRNPVTAWTDERIRAEENALFCFVGRLDEDKGADLAARAAALAGVRIRFIGTGPLEGRIAELNPEAELCGWQPRERIGALCRDGRALIFATRWRETFGLAALEGAGSGLPLVMSDSVLLSGELEVAGIALRFPTGDADVLAGALKQLAADDQAVARMSETAYREALSFCLADEEWSARLVAMYGDAARV